MHIIKVLNWKVEWGGGYRTPWTPLSSASKSEGWGKGSKKYLVVHVVSAISTMTTLNNLIIEIEIISDYTT